MTSTSPSLPLARRPLLSSRSARRTLSLLCQSVRLRLTCACSPPLLCGHSSLPSPSLYGRATMPVRPVHSYVLPPASPSRALPLSACLARIRPPPYCREHSAPRQTGRGHSYGVCGRSKPPLAPTKLSTRCIVRRFSPAYPQWRVRLLLHSTAIAITSLQVRLQTIQTRTTLTGSNLQFTRAEECEYSMQQAL